MQEFYFKKFFLSLLLLIACLGLPNLAKAQSTLSAGNIIFTGYDASPAVAGDKFSFVLLTPISAGTVIHFTDRGYFGGSSWQADNSNTEGTITWTSSTALQTGTEITITNTTSSTGSVIANSANTGLSLSNVGDQIIAFQGGGGNPSGGGASMIAGIHWGDCNGTNTSSGTWDVIGAGCSQGPNSSALPPSLIGGTSAFWVGRNGTGVFTKGYFDGTGVPSSSPTAIRNAVMNENNWIRGNPATPATVLVPTGHTYFSTCTAPSITGNPPNRTICVNGNTTFTGNATGATAFKWQENTGSGFTDISNGGVYSNATTTTLNITGATGGMNGYQYRLVAINGTASCFTNSTAGTLSVSNITATGSSTAISCFGGVNGTATVSSVTGGVGPYTYSWSPSGGTAATATGLAANTYTCTITDNIGCSTQVIVVVGQPTSAVSAAITTTNNVTCPGGTNGNMTVTPSGGTPGYTYLWNTGATTATIFGLTAGTYTCTVRDANNCPTTASATITAPPAFVTSSNVTNVSCNGGANGTATISVTSGGVGPFTYQWSASAGSQTTATATGLSAGSYSVTVRDANLCPIVISGIIVTQPTALSATSSKTNVSCNGGGNGTATVVPSGGVGGYTYSWSPSGGTNATATGLAVGNYTVTITDANSCQITRDFVITQPTALSAATGGGSTNVSCNGGANGTATVAPTGGTPGYTYLWAPSGGTSATATGLGVGTYTVTVTDANSCTTTRSFTINQPATVLSAVTGGGSTNVSCFGGANGTATVAPSGGTPGYTYSWSPSGGTSATATGLAAGSYIVTVTDANGCQATRNFTINQPATALSTSSTSQTNIACNGGSTGAASVNVIGGTASYTYSWSPSGGTGATATGLTAGNYTVTITDANACQITRSFTITQPPALVVTPVAQTNIACNGGATGSATVSATGGVGTLTYSWAPSGGTSATATGLVAGTYTVTVTDANSCSKTQSFTIVQPPALVASAGTQTNVSCNNGSNGSATVVATGGTPGYTYSWAPSGGTAATATGLAAGAYTVTVTDANGCSKTQTFTITQPPALVASIGSQTTVSCNGGTNGSATVAVTGGTGAYTYSWSPIGGTAATATGLAAGIYTVTVTDANNCQTTQSFTITQPTLLSATQSQTNILCNGTATGSASVTVSGGAGAYTYSWSPSGGTAATATGLSAGTYTVTITDANSCFITRTFNIAQPTALTTTAGTTTNVSCNNGANGSATVVATGGAGAYTYSWSPSGGTAATATGLSAGTYTVTVTDANLCSTTRSFAITQPSALIASSGGQYNVSCNGGTNGAATVAVTGGSGAYTYSWSPMGGTAATASGLAAGTYTVTVTDANLCSVTQSFTITEPPVLAVTTSQTNVLCNGSSTGTATVNVTGGSGAYTYLWSPMGGTAATASGLAVGIYTVTITDANGCTKTQSFTITQPSALVASSSQTNVACNGGATGSLSVLPNGGTSPYTYLWSTGATSSSINGLTVGTYSVTITDANGCTNVKNFTLTQPTAITATQSQSNATAFGAANGSASVVATGGTPGYTYSWAPSGGTAATATGLVAGNYTITITDANACSITKNFTITQPAGVSGVTASTANGTYKIGDVINVQVNFHMPVTVTGTPQLALNAGANALYDSGNGTSSLVFKYTVVSGNQIADLDYTSTTALTLAGGTIKDALNNNATLTLPAPGAAGSLGANKNIVIDGIAPVAPVIAAVADGTTVYTGLPAINGTAEIGSTVSLQIDAATVSTSIPVGAGGTWTYTLTAALLDGTHTLKALTTDAAGNPSVYSATNTFTLITVPTITATGTLNALNTVYGTASASTQFAVSGVNMKAGILVSPPVGFEVSANNTTFSNTVTIGTIGMIASTPVYLRLKNTSAVGSYSGNIVLSSTDAVNVNKATVASTVTAAPLNITANQVTKTYGDVLTASTGSTAFVASGLKNSETVGTVSLAYGTGAAANDPIGTYTARVTPGAAVGGTFTASNYNITYVAGNIVVGVKAVTVTAEAKSKVYGGAEPALTYTVSPALVSGDSFTGALSRVPGEAVGNYIINRNNLALSSNYALTYVGANLTITKKPLDVIATNASKTYNGLAFSGGNGVTYSGFVGSDNAANSLTGTLTYTGTAQGAINAGTYVITPAGYASANYQPNYVNGTLTVNKATLIAKADDKVRCFGQANPSFTISYTGFVNGETVSAVNTAPVMTTTANTNSVANTYPITITGGTATNYVFTYQNGTLMVNPLPVVSIVSSKGTSLSKGETTVLTATGGTSYTWANAAGIISGQNTAALTVRPSQTTTYTVTVTNANGCSQSNAVTIVVVEDYMMISGTNILTPNGDGKNDYLVIRNIDMYPNNEIKIFDIAGRIVYSKKSYDNTWDGSFNGSPLAKGTYYYIIDFGDGKLKRKGFVSIVRD